MRGPMHLDEDDLADLEQEMESISSCSGAGMRGVGGVVWGGVTYPTSNAARNKQAGKPPPTAVQLKVNLDEKAPTPARQPAPSAAPARTSRQAPRDVPAQHHAASAEASSSVSTRGYHGATGVDICWGGRMIKGGSPVPTDVGKIGRGNSRSMGDRMWLGKGPPESSPQPTVVEPVSSSPPVSARSDADELVAQNLAIYEQGLALASSPAKPVEPQQQQQAEEEAFVEEEEEPAFAGIPASHQHASPTGRQGSDLFAAKSARQSTPPRQRLGAGGSYQSTPTAASPAASPVTPVAYSTSTVTTPVASPTHPAVLIPATDSLAVAETASEDGMNMEAHHVHYHETRTSQPVCVQLWHTGTLKYRQELAASQERAGYMQRRNEAILARSPASPKRATAHADLTGDYRAHYSSFSYGQGLSEGHGKKSFPSLSAKEWQQ